MKKILVVFGTRPEAIKMAPLIKELKNNNNEFETKICVTGQHRQMLDQVLSFFKIIPDYDLDIMKANQDLHSIASEILLKIKPIFDDFAPDIVLVHGDTATTFSTSLAAYYQKIKIGHVEAGLRTGNMYSPWPEEGNRSLTGVLSYYHFAPTENSKNNLIREGVHKDTIHVTGNTVIDALKIVNERIENDTLLRSSIKERIIKSGFKEFESKFILVTGHRRENFGEGFTRICESLRLLAKNNPDINIVYPVHLNPSVREPVTGFLSDIKNIKLVEPFQYEEFIYLMSKSFLILTDSGGIQEEAPSLGKPVLVMRDITERLEALSAGTVKLVGSDKENIIREVQKLLDDSDEYNKMCKAVNPYGDGKSSKKIIDVIKNNL